MLGGVVCHSIILWAELKQSDKHQKLTFDNFHAILKFTASFILGQREGNLQIRGTPKDDAISSKSVIDEFMKIREQIKNEKLEVDFRDIYYATYHYMKHKTELYQALTVGQYYKMIRAVLEKVTKLPEYNEMKNRTSISSLLCYSVRLKELKELKDLHKSLIFGKQDGFLVKCILKMENEKLVLLTAYRADDIAKGAFSGLVHYGCIKGV